MHPINHISRSHQPRAFHNTQESNIKAALRTKLESIKDPAVFAKLIEATIDTDYYSNTRVSGNSVTAKASNPNKDIWIQFMLKNNQVEAEQYKGPEGSTHLDQHFNQSQLINKILSPYNPAGSLEAIQEILGNA